MEWKSIETAPKDGSRILITDGVLLTVAQWWFWEERPTMSVGQTATGWSTEQILNPKAGERHYSWMQDNPVAFREEDEVSPDHDGQFDRIAPTHWMPLPPTPAPESEK